MFLHTYSWQDLGLTPVGPKFCFKEIRQLYMQQKLQGMKTYGIFCKRMVSLFKKRTPAIRGGSWGGPVVRKMGRPRGEIFTKKELRNRVEG